MYVNRWMDVRNAIAIKDSNWIWTTIVRVWILTSVWLITDAIANVWIRLDRINAIARAAFDWTTAISVWISMNVKTLWMVVVQRKPIVLILSEVFVVSVLQDSNWQPIRYRAMVSIDFYEYSNDDQYDWVSMGKCWIFLKMHFHSIEIKDTCAAIAPPEHGDVRCTRSRHRTQLFYRTKCTIWCREGFTLNGPSVKHCNGTEGTWDETPTTCVRKYFQLFHITSDLLHM